MMIWDFRIRIWNRYGTTFLRKVDFIENSYFTVYKKILLNSNKMIHIYLISLRKKIFKKLIRMKSSYKKIGCRYGTSIFNSRELYFSRFFEKLKVFHIYFEIWKKGKMEIIK